MGTKRVSWGKNFNPPHNPHHKKKNPKKKKWENPGGAPKEGNKTQKNIVWRLPGPPFPVREKTVLAPPSFKLNLPQPPGGGKGGWSCYLWGPSLPPFLPPPLPP
eukprot:FR743437.1.p2 GENE.FR743437.1~~FR743437.1.p2  ORF type:complete len:104 (+),score=61.47 FR743437.1:899-1210(+)